MSEAAANDRHSVWSRYLRDRESIWRVFREFRDNGDLVSLRFEAVDTAFTARIQDVDHRRVKRPGATAINLAASSRDPSRFTQLNEGYLTLIPAPTDAANDSIDGRITVVTAAPPLSSSAQLQLLGDRLHVSGTDRDERIFIADSSAQKFADELSEKIIAPAAPFLQNKRLLIVADGALQYVPFAALKIQNSKFKIQNWFFNLES